MAEKILNSRIINKHDTEANWLKATGFTPKQGEIIVYDIDENYNYERIKIGDGVQNVNALPFVNDALPEYSIHNNDKNIHYYKLFTITTTSINVDCSYEFYVTERDSDLCKITAEFKSVSDRNITGSIYYEGGLFASKYLKGYLYHDDTANSNTIEVWCQVSAWNEICFYPKTNMTRCCKLEWDIEEKDSFPTDATSTVEVLPKQWVGNAATATKATQDASGNIIESTYATKTELDAISTFVGDKSVSDQIDKALLNNQSDWNQSDDTASDFIKNKPTLVGIAGTGENSEIFNHYTANKANGTYSHAEGYGTTADGNYTHVEGSNTAAKKVAAHAEGQGTVANGTNSHAEGYRTTTLGDSAHSEGLGNTKCPTDITYGTDDDVIIETWKTTSKFTLAKGKGSHAEGYSTLALGDYSHAEGSNNIANGESSHAEGDTTVASGKRSHAEGYKTTASGNDSHAEGNTTTAGGQYAHAEGYSSIASGAISHAEGSATVAKGQASHTEGYGTVSIGYAAHAEGYSTYKVPDTITSSTNNTTIIEEHQTTPFTLAKGQGSHAEGYDTLSLGAYASHAEGYRTRASGDYSHAEGGNTVASGMRSHAEGYNTIASSANQHVQGKYNIEDTNSQYAHIVGNGSGTERSNAHTIDWQGNAWFAGDIRVGGTCYADAISLLPKRTSVTLPAANWTGSANPWSQVVTISGITANSKVDLQPTAVQIVEMQNNDIALMTENNDGVITVYAIGSKPAKDYTMQVLITEVIPI